jgi:hypothetical protein
MASWLSECEWINDVTIIIGQGLYEVVVNGQTIYKGEDRDLAYLLEDEWSCNMLEQAKLPKPKCPKCKRPL